MTSRRGRWPGTWRVICDVCGVEYASDQVQKRWDGLIVCRKDYETRHPQEFVRGVADNSTPAFTRPEPPDVFVDVPYIVPLSCTPLGSTGIAGYAVAGCSRPGITLESLIV